jgi:hypothetical protein
MNLHHSATLDLDFEELNALCAKSTLTFGALSVGDVFASTLTKKGSKLSMCFLFLVKLNKKEALEIGCCVKGAEDLAPSTHWCGTIHTPRKKEIAVLAQSVGYNLVFSTPKEEVKPKAHHIKDDVDLLKGLGYFKLKSLKQAAKDINADNFDIALVRKNKIEHYPNVKVLPAADTWKAANHALIRGESTQGEEIAVSKSALKEGKVLVRRTVAAFKGASPVETADA